jgi:endoglucanase
MKKTALILIISVFCVSISFSQSVAQKRAATMKLGMNLSYLDNWWNGTREKNFSDFAKPEDAAKREKMFTDIAKAGFKTVRVPICFGAWMELKKPYNWNNPKALEMADNFVKWALSNDLNVVIDLHHTEYDRSIPDADTAERMVNLWVRIAERYKNTNPEKVFFELRNEPNKMDETAWRWQAEQIIKYIRPIAPKHTLVIGFTEWNSRKQMIVSKPFSDPNIIYTFHYYDPFLFSHQGATWSGDGLADLKYVPFPYSKSQKIDLPSKAKGTWTEGLISNYEKDSNAAKMFADLKEAKDWSVKNKVPIFIGEVGSYNLKPTIEDRCRHAEVIYSALGKLDIPSAWWEWDGGFSMFAKDTTKIADCMKKAIDSYSSQVANK